MKKRILITAAVAAVSLGLAWLVAGSFSETKPARAERAPSAVAVTVVHPTMEPVYDEIRYLGTVEGDSDAKLSFRIAGSVAAVHVGEGDRVSRGARLATLEQPEMQARQQRARAELEKAEANLQYWKAELEIDERLLAKGAVARTRRDQTELSFENALRARQAAAAGLEEASGAATAAVLRAPTDGVIARIERRAGETVMPGQPVLSLNAGARRVRVDVLESDVFQDITTGAPAVIASSACEGVEGRVGGIDTSVGGPFRSVRLYVDVPQACLAGRPTGSTVSVTFHVHHQEEAVMVPASAIDFRAGQPRIFRIGKDGRAEPVLVRLGVQHGSVQQIDAAVGPEDRIIVSGTSNLQAGDRLNVVVDESTLDGTSA